jgi:hypothetical protein
MASINWNDLVCEIRTGAGDDRCIQVAQGLSTLSNTIYWAAQHLITYSRTGDVQHLATMEDALQEMRHTIDTTLSHSTKEINATQAQELPDSTEATNG